MLTVRVGTGGWRGPKEEADAFVQFGFAVVVCEDRGEGARAGEVFWWPAVQAEAECGFVFIKVHDEFLQLVEDVSGEVPVVGAIDMEGIGRAEAGPDQQGQDLLQGSQRSQRPYALGRGKGGRVTRRGTTLG